MNVDTVWFNSPCILEKLKGKLWRLHLPFSFTVYYDSGASEQFTAPAGLVTDLASIPRLPLVYLLFGEKAAIAGVTHDYFYSTGERSREFADAVFYAAMRHEEPAWRRALMWLAVRLAGWVFYFSKERTA